MSNLPLQFSEFGKEGFKNKKKSNKKKNRTYKNHDMKKRPFMILRPFITFAAIVFIENAEFTMF